MAQNEINFKQERDFGELFNATFTFIGKEFKKLGTAILYYVLPFLLVASILGVVVGIKQQDAVGAMENYPASVFSVFNIYYFLSILLVIIASTSLSCTTLGYIKLYVNKGQDNFNVSDVGSEVLRYFFPVLGATFVLGALVAIGVILCIIPGIWVGVSLSIFLPLLVIEEQDFGDAFTRSFKLIKTRFWKALGLVLVSLILVYILSILFSLPTIISGMKTFFVNIREPQPENMNFGTTFYVLNSISSLLTYLISVIPAVLFAFFYFSLVEYNERPGLNDKIDQISTNE